MDSSQARPCASPWRDSKDAEKLSIAPFTDRAASREGHGRRGLHLASCEETLADNSVVYLQSERGAAEGRQVRGLSVRKRSSAGVESRWINAKASLDSSARKAEFISAIRRLCLVYSKSANPDGSCAATLKQNCASFGFDASALLSLAEGLVQENAFLQSFVSGKDRVLQNGEMRKLKIQCDSLADRNRVCESQVEKYKKALAELGFRTRTLADLVRWLQRQDAGQDAQASLALIERWRREAGPSALEASLAEGACEAALPARCEPQPEHTLAGPSEPRLVESLKRRVWSLEKALSEERALKKQAEWRAARTWGEAAPERAEDSAELQNLRSQAQVNARRAEAAAIEVAELKALLAEAQAQAEAAGLRRARTLHDAQDKSRSEENGEGEGGAPLCAQWPDAGRQEAPLETRRWKEEAMTAQRECEELRKELASTRRQREEDQAALTAASAEVEELRKKLEAETSAASLLVEEKTRVEASLREATAELEEIHIQNAQLLAQLEGLNAESDLSSTGESERDSYSSQIARLEKQLETLKGAASENSGLKTQVAVLQTLLKTMASKKERLHPFGDGVAKESVVCGEAAGLRAECESLRRRIAELESREALKSSHAAGVSPPTSSTLPAPLKNVPTKFATPSRPKPVGPQTRGSPLSDEDSALGSIQTSSDSSECAALKLENSQLKETVNNLGKENARLKEQLEASVTQCDARSSALPEKEALHILEKERDALKLRVSALEEEVDNVKAMQNSIQAGNPPPTLSSAVLQPSATSNTDAPKALLSANQEAEIQRLKQHIDMLQNRLCEADKLKENHERLVKDFEQLQCRYAERQASAADSESKTKQYVPELHVLKQKCIQYKTEIDKPKPNPINVTRKQTAATSTTDMHTSEPADAETAAAKVNLPAKAKLPPPPVKAAEAPGVTAASADANAKETFESAGAETAAAKVNLPAKAKLPPPPVKAAKAPGVTAASADANAKETSESAGAETAAAKVNLPAKAKLPPPPVKAAKAPGVTAAGGETGKDSSDLTSSGDAVVIGREEFERLERAAVRTALLEKQVSELEKEVAAKKSLLAAHEQLKKELEAVQQKMEAQEHAATEASTGACALSSAAVLECSAVEKKKLLERIAHLEACLAAEKVSGQADAAVPSATAGREASQDSHLIDSKQTPSVSKRGSPESPVAASGPFVKGQPFHKMLSDLRSEQLAAQGLRKSRSTPVGDSCSAGPHGKAPKFVGSEARQEEATLWTIEELSTDDEEGGAAVAHEAALRKRLEESRRRIRALVFKCNALLHKHATQQTTQLKMQALQEEHRLLQTQHADLKKQLEAFSREARAGEKAPDVEGAQDRKIALEEGNSLKTPDDDASGSDELPAKYARLKEQRDKLYQAFKSQKTRIELLEREGSELKEKLQVMEKQYKDSQEEIEAMSKASRQPHEAGGLFAWFGGGQPDEHSVEEQRIHARLELTQQKLRLLAEENHELQAQLRDLKAEKEKLVAKAAAPVDVSEAKGATPKEAALDAKQGEAAREKEALEQHKALQREFEAQSALLKENEAKLREALATAAEAEELKKKVQDLEALVAKKEDEIQQLKGQLSKLLSERSLAEETAKLAANNGGKSLKGKEAVERAGSAESSESLQAEKKIQKAEFQKTEHSTTHSKRVSAEQPVRTKAAGKDSEENKHANVADGPAEKALQRPSLEAGSKKKNEAKAGGEEATPKTKSGKHESDDGGASTKKKKSKEKKKKAPESEGEASAAETPKRASSQKEDSDAGAGKSGGWAFGFFGATAASSADADDAEAHSQAASPGGGLFEMLIGGEPRKNADAVPDHPPLRLSTVQGADEPEEEEPSSEEEAGDGIASTIAGFFWGV